jgi:hypothetical protein
MLGKELLFAIAFDLQNNLEREHSLEKDSL